MILEAMKEEITRILRNNLQIYNKLYIIKTKSNYFLLN